MQDRPRFMPPARPSIAEAVMAIRDRRTSAAELLEAARAAHDAHAELNALAWVDWAAAAEDAARCDREAKQGMSRGLLHGIPLSVKDIYNVDGMPTRAGTRATLPNLGTGDAAAVGRLRGAGAVLLGKANTNEVAFGATGENVWTNDVKNPWNETRQSGGSSSGSCAGVAAGIGMGSLGSDTGGSIRIPASFCGVVGFKPSFGQIPMTGALPLARTCDHAGPIARTIEDAGLLYAVMANRDPAVPAVGRRPRFAVPASWLAGRLHDAVANAFDGLLSQVRRQADVVEVEVPSLTGAYENYMTIVRAEAARTHERALAAGGAGFSDAVLAALRAGQAVSRPDYMQALQSRRALCADLASVFGDVDAMLLPTSPVPVPVRGQDTASIGGRLVTLRAAVVAQTAPFSLAGVPAVTLPMMQAAGMPLGLQVVAAVDRDASLLSICDWLKRHLGSPASDETCSG
jgi:aspartyl-tRNA(Asn)/glutamyl-tRNA(Gln) amidotransferase subunit A